MGRNLRSLINNYLKRFWSKRKFKELYEQNNFLDAYSEHTDIRVQIDPYEAVGGMWEQIGKLQFDFLLKNGLKRHHRLLDIGCGTLRGGRYFIDYLDKANYTGMDISKEAIQFAKRLVAQEGLSEKTPRLLVSKYKDLKFKEFDGEIFDYLLAQSVFTHLKPEHIEECFSYVGKIMEQDSFFFFTFKESLEFKQTGLKDFTQPLYFYQFLADKNGFELRNCSEEYRHPRGQSAAFIRKLV